MTMTSICLTAFIAATILFQATAIERFRQGGRLDRMRVMSDVVMGRMPASDAEVQEVLEAAMRDSDPFIRRQAVGSVASILQLSAMPQQPPGQEWATRLRPVAEALRDELERAAGDPDFGVRMEAWRGILGPITWAAPKKSLPLPLVERLAKVYDTDKDARMRAFALQALNSAHRSEDPAARTIAVRILMTALRETDPGVVQAAGWGAIEARVPEALPLLVAQLQNPSHIGRMGAAVGLQAYGADARRYLPEMEEALLKEPEGPTRKTLEATIKLVREARVP
jgi:hypothetical protein